MREAWLGAGCLFVAAALYYGLMPPHSGSGDHNLANITSPAPVHQDARTGAEVAVNTAPTPAPVAVNAPQHHRCGTYAFTSFYSGYQKQLRRRPQASAYQLSSPDTA